MEDKSVEDIYFYFRKAQAESKSRGFRMPKDFEKHLSTRMSEKNREALRLVTKYFNTKWKNVDVYKFMSYGFELFRNFTYTQFFDQRVINLYIEKDKILKREINISKTSIRDSAFFIKKYMKRKGIPSLSRYCMLRARGSSLPVFHYMQNKVDKFLLVWFINIGYIRLDDDERAMIPYIVEQYREILVKIEEMKDFLKEVQKVLEVNNG